MYAHLGVASAGLEIGDDFYQDCGRFESKVYPENLKSLMYAIKLARRPNALVKGLDVFNLTVMPSPLRAGGIQVTASASDSKLVNIPGYAEFPTGDQDVVKVELYLNVHPDKYDADKDKMYTLLPDASSGSGMVSFKESISTNGLGSGRHALYAQATDSDGYPGPISSVFFVVNDNKRGKSGKSSKTPKSAKSSKKV